MGFIQTYITNSLAELVSTVSSSVAIHYPMSEKVYIDNFEVCRVSHNFVHSFPLTLNSVYIQFSFKEKLAITKENLYTKYFPFTYKYVTLNEKPPINEGKSPHFFFHYRQS